MKVTRYIRHTWRTIKVLKFLFVLKIVNFVFGNSEPIFGQLDLRSSVSLNWGFGDAGQVKQSEYLDIHGPMMFLGIQGFIFLGLYIQGWAYLCALPSWPFLMILLWQPPKWEVWNKHRWAEGTKALNFQIFQKGKRNLQHEYPPEAHGEA